MGRARGPARSRPWRSRPPCGPGSSRTSGAGCPASWRGSRPGCPPPTAGGAGRSRPRASPCRRWTAGRPRRRRRRRARRGPSCRPEGSSGAIARPPRAGSDVRRGRTGSSAPAPPRRPSSVRRRRSLGPFSLPSRSSRRPALSAPASNFTGLMTEALFDNGNAPEPPAAAPTRLLREMCDGDQVTGAFVVRERDRRQKRNGEHFLRVVLADKTGTVPAIAWDGVAELFEACAPGSIVLVRGSFSIHPQFGRQIKLAAVRPAGPGEYDAEQLTEGPARSIELLEPDMRELIGTVQNASLRRLLDRFFGAETQAWARFREAPAAKHYHQAYAGGLLEHSLSVAQAVSAAANFFPGIDREIAVTGAMLHDIGKTEAYNDDPLAIELTDAGRLEGEIPRGYYLVRREIERIDGFDPDLAQAILHIILSHHGQLEHGSPVVPCTREATLVHAIDNLGGKLGSFDRLEKELAEGESWSRFDRGIDSSAFLGCAAAWRPPARSTMSEGRSPERLCGAAACGRDLMAKP